MRIIMGCAISKMTLAAVENSNGRCSIGGGGVGGGMAGKLKMGVKLPAHAPSPAAAIVVSERKTKAFKPRANGGNTDCISENGGITSLSSSFASFAMNESECSCAEAGSKNSPANSFVSADLNQTIIGGDGTIVAIPSPMSPPTGAAAASSTGDGVLPPQLKEKMMKPVKLSIPKSATHASRARTDPKTSSTPKDQQQCNIVTPPTYSISLSSRRAVLTTSRPTKTPLHPDTFSNLDNGASPIAGLKLRRNGNSSKIASPAVTSSPLAAVATKCLLRSFAEAASSPKVLFSNSEEQGQVGRTQEEPRNEKKQSVEKAEKGQATFFVMWIFLPLMSIASAFLVAMKRKAITKIKFGKFMKLLHSNIPLVCAIGTFILHASIIFSGEFVWDDRAAVLGNPDVLGNRGILAIFSHDFWGDEMSSRNSHKSFRPFTILSLRMSRALYGLNAKAFHFDCVLLHSLVVYLYAILCSRLTIAYMKQDKRRAQNVATMASIMFAVHPVHVEPVCSIVGRSDILSGLWFLVALLLYTPDSGPLRIGFAALFGAVSTLSKEVGVTVFGLFAASDIIKSISNRHQPITVFNKYNALKFFFAFSCALALTIYHLSLHGSEMLHNFTILENSIYLQDSRLTRILSYANIQVLYLWKLIWPYHLSYDYGWPCIPHVETLSDARVVPIFIALTAILVLGAVSLKRRNGMMMWGLAMMIIPFIPASNIMFPVGAELAERLLYVPSMGFAILVAYLAGTGNAIVVKAKQLVFKSIICAMAVKSFSRSQDWANEKSLFTSALDVCPGSLKVLNNFAQLHITTDPQLAIQHLEKAAAIHPNYASVHFNRGVAENSLGNFQSSIQSFERVLKLRPLDSRVRLFLASSLFSNAKQVLGIDNDMAHGQMKEAISHLDESIKKIDARNPRVLHIRCEIGSVMADFGGNATNARQYCLDAISVFRQLEEEHVDTIGKELDIALDVTFNTLGLLERQAGRLDNAVKYLQEGLEVNSQNFDITLNLGALYVDLKQFDLANEAYENAEAILPDSPDLRAYLLVNKGWLQENMKMYQAAMENYRLALEIQKDNPHPQIVTNLHNIEAMCIANICE